MLSKLQGCGQQEQKMRESPAREGSSRGEKRLGGGKDTRVAGGGESWRKGRCWQSPNYVTGRGG